ncbi:MAG: RDD family protein [Nitrosopumilaceae archaeon]|uniref:RDD family protein n=2 Tax=Candidatus Nitrosomaritimum aestuariumsis TaxID=3342354 RepID=A0AC60WA88_9ARCH|nr:RDD family protein [Nitrosopumilaceae archaeon]MBA4460288.1 RDD family protein [Nitrosopumilaceae archaeon]MBA4461231.1 RDD family protein [Nitrosopumilaceae archaeon]MBA4463919.1 RDD family protein [Nitrosopumilaceae archaeon]
MSDSEEFKEILIAKWSDRFIAWLIDFIIISAISGMIFASIFGVTNFEWNENMMFSESTSYIPASLLFFVYWIILEYKGGQSIGKKILHLKVANIDGKPPQLLGVIISSFGKAFLLPIDMILGLIFTNQKRQRIFNKIGDTVVIKIKNTESDSENIKYKKD